MSGRITYVDGAGALKEVSVSTPLPTTGTGSGPSVGLTGSSAPTSADEIGWVDGSGNLVNVSASTPLPVSATVTADEIVKNVTGTIASAAVLSNFPVDTTGFRTACVQVTNAGSTCTLIVEQSNDGTTWYGIQTPTDLTIETATPMTAVGIYSFPISAINFRVRCSVYGSGNPAVNVELRQGAIDYALQSLALGASSAVIGHVIVDSGSLTANAGTNLNTSLLALESGGNLATVAGTVSSSKVNVNISSGSIGNTTFAATQATASNLKAQVIGAGTAGTADAGVLTIQGIAAMTKLLVTPDSVALPANQSVNVSQVNGTTVLVNTGAVGTGSQRVAVGTDTATVAGSAPGSAGSPNVYVGVSGAAASGASVVGNPLLSGARGATANPTAVTDGQAVALMADKLGKLVAVGAIRTLKGTQKTTITASTAETTIVTAVASTFLDLYGLILANTGATTTKVDIRDTTSGTIIATFEVPTIETRGFMLPVDSAIPQTTVNTNWTAQCGSSTSSLEVTALYVKNI